MLANFTTTEWMDGLYCDTAHIYFIAAHIQLLTDIATIWLKNL